MNLKLIFIAILLSIGFLKSPVKVSAESSCSVAVNVTRDLSDPNKPKFVYSISVNTYGLDSTKEYYVASEKNAFSSKAVKPDKLTSRYSSVPKVQNFFIYNFRKILLHFR